MDVNKITKEQFDTAYNKYLPNKWIKFAYKYFSNETEKKNMSLKNTILYVLFGLFGVGFICTIFGLSKPIIVTITIIYSILLVVLVFYLFSAVFLNNLRINKICEKLNITKEEYNTLVTKIYS
jgi:multidrug efflux pump subunit AcrB